jgi:hypothetical protein
VFLADFMIEYVGRNYGPYSYALDPNQYFLGVFDPSSGALELNRCGGVFKMEQDVAAIHAGGDDDEGPHGAEEEEEEEEKELSQAARQNQYLAKRQQFVEEFQSSKRRRLVAKQMGNRVDLQHTSSAAASSVIGGISSTISDEKAVATARVKGVGATSNVLPAHDRDTNVLEDVYPLDQMAPDAVQAQLNETFWYYLVKKRGSDYKTEDGQVAALDEALRAVAKEDDLVKHVVRVVCCVRIVSLGVMGISCLHTHVCSYLSVCLCGCDSIYVCVQVRHIRSCTARGERDKMAVRKSKCRLLDYFVVLRQLSVDGRAKQRKAWENTAALELPTAAEAHLQERFFKSTPKRKNTHGKHHQLRTIMDTLVVFLHLMDFMVADSVLPLLAKSFKYSKQQLVEYLKLIGCTLRKQQGSAENFLKLTCPLELPELRMNQANRRQN